MRGLFLFAAALIAGPCSSTADNAPATTQASAAAASATAAAAVATAAVASAAAAVAAAPHAQSPTGPCALLALKCKKCPPGVVETACNGALTAGSLDPSACTNALNDKDIKAECGGGGPAPMPSSTTTTPVAPPALPGGGPCAQLAAKCAKCPPGIVKMACSGALTAGSLDPSACTNALNDKDIKSQCN
jgi:hypothetical protein